MHFLSSCKHQNDHGQNWDVCEAVEKDETLAAFILFTCIGLVQDDETGGELTQRGCPMSNSDPGHPSTTFIPHRLCSF